MKTTQVVLVVAILALLLGYIAVSGGGQTTPRSEVENDRPAANEKAVQHEGSKAVSPVDPDDPFATDLPKKQQPEYCNQGNIRGWRPGKCAEDQMWLLPWMAKRQGAEWTMVDVGANKGYVIAEWLETLVEQTPFSPHNLGIGIFTNYSSQVKYNVFMGLCGGCCECVGKPTQVPSSHRASKVKVFGFEPSVANHKWLDTFFFDKNVVEITHAAVSSTPSKAYFPNNEFGVETGKVLSAPAPGYVPVNVVTLDTHLKGVDFIHVLSTDAEGFDQEVAKGAEGFLKNGRVGVYQFEMYKDMDYKPVFDQLEDWGYVCWFATSSRKIRITSKKQKEVMKKWVRMMMRKFGITKNEALHPLVPKLVRITGCWEQAYRDYHGWVNGLCHNKKVPELNAIFDTLSRDMWRGSGGNCEGKTTQQTMVDAFVKRFVHPAGLQIAGKSNITFPPADQMQSGAAAKALPPITPAPDAGGEE